MNSILEADRRLFEIINTEWTSPILDAVLPFMRASNFWLPLYLFLGVYAIVNVPKWGWFVLMTIVTAALTDVVSSHMIKKWVFRVRPCGEPSLAEIVRVLALHCPIKNSSFTSSHAANHFGLATFFVVTLKPYMGRWVYIFFLWAFVIIYAQIYVGVHYPLDVLAGAAVGIMAGLLTSGIYQKRWGNLVNAKS